MKQQKYQEQEPIPIEYEEIVDGGSHVTGIARISSPSGEGDFEIRVSGQREAVVQYGETAAVVALSIRPITEDYEQITDERKNSALEFKRSVWHERLDQIKDLVYQADLDLLADPINLCRRIQDNDKLQEFQCPMPDLFQDRHIQIRPLDDFEPEAYYGLSFTIDPDVPRGRRDIYKPYINDINSAWGRIEMTGGDADLYLYRGSSRRDISISSGKFDEVYAVGGSGEWRLHVYGFTDASYILSGDWVLSYNNVW